MKTSNPKYKIGDTLDLGGWIAVVVGYNEDGSPRLDTSFFGTWRHNLPAFCKLLVKVIDAANESYVKVAVTSEDLRRRKLEIQRQIEDVRDEARFKIATLENEHRTSIIKGAMDVMDNVYFQVAKATKNPSPEPTPPSSPPAITNREAIDVLLASRGATTPLMFRLEYPSDPRLSRNILLMGTTITSLDGLLERVKLAYPNLWPSLDEVTFRLVDATNPRVNIATGLLIDPSQVPSTAPAGGPEHPAAPTAAVCEGLELGPATIKRVVVSYAPKPPTARGDRGLERGGWWASRRGSSRSRCAA